MSIKRQAPANRGQAPWNSVSWQMRWPELCDVLNDPQRASEYSEFEYQELMAQLDEVQQQLMGGQSQN